MAQGTLNAQATDASGKNWTLTVALDGAVALYLMGEALASMSADEAQVLFADYPDVTVRMERLLEHLAELGARPDEMATDQLMVNAEWLDNQWG